MVDLTLIWAGIIAFGVFMYVLMDGFDLGIGILFPFAPSDAARDDIMNSVAPVWDGNETWLVLGGAGLLAAFPLAYSIILPALYIPILLMLIALVFRGVAFEFRFKANRSRYLWDIAFTVGSTFAALFQGMILGAFIQGFTVVGTRYVGGPLDWLTPFSIVTGMGLVAGYALIGATWINMKTENAVQEWACNAARWLLAVVIVFIGIVSLWTPLTQPDIAARWFDWPNIAFLSPVPLATVLVAWLLYRGLEMRQEIAPFIWAIGLFSLSYLGLAISLWPHVIPPSVTIWDAASDPGSQLFLLLGVLLVLPFILIYTAFTYWVFRGKVRSGSGGYH